MKKSLIFWFAAATCAAWILVGCEQGTGGDGAAGAAGAPGTTQLSANITAASLQKIVDAGGPILISGAVEIGAGYVDLKTASVTVDAALTFAAGSIVNARSANVVVGAGSITGTNAVIIPPAGASVWDSVAGHTSAGLVSVAEFVAATGSGNYAVESLSVNASGIGGTALATATGSKTVYVLGTLAIDAASAVDTDTANLVALGETTAAGAGGITFGDNTKIGTLKATGALKITAVGAGGVEKLDLNGNTVTITADDNIGVITSGAAGAVLTLPSDGQIVPITVGGYDIAIGGTPASVTIAELATPGAGKLVLPATAISFTATAGGGKIAYAAAPASLTLSSTTGLTYVGNLSVAGAVSLGGDLTVTGTATLGSTLTNTAAAVATFNDETEVTGMVTSGSGGLTIGGTGAVTLTAAPTITNGLTVTNTTGVTMPSVTGVASQSIDASAGKVIFGNATGSVAITNGTLASGTGSAGAAANGAVTLTNGATLTLADTGTIVVAGTGSVVLPNSIFGAGTYTVTGTVTISSLTAGDTIVTGATDNTDKLAVGVLLLGEVTSAGTNAATYTLVKSNAGDKVSLDAANGKITLPADTGTTKGASLTVTAYAGITLGATGSIELGRKVSGAGAGKLALVAGATIGVFADTTAGNFNITSAANVADADDEATEKVAFGSANSSGTITAALKDVYGANGTAGYAVINTDTTLSS